MHRRHHTQVLEILWTRNHFGKHCLYWPLAYHLRGRVSCWRLQSWKSKFCFILSLGWRLIERFDNSSLMDLPKIRTVVSDPSDPDGDRLVLLRMSAQCMDFTIFFSYSKVDSTRKPVDIPPEAGVFLRKEAKELVEYKVDLDYDYWTAGNCLTRAEIPEDAYDVRSDECLQVFLPEELREGSPTGFAMTGHIGACISSLLFFNSSDAKYFLSSSCQFERWVSAV